MTVANTLADYIMAKLTVTVVKSFVVQTLGVLSTVVIYTPSK
jgi:hypothetical protein